MSYGTSYLSPVRHGSTSVRIRVWLGDSSVNTGAGKTGLTSASAGLIISLHHENANTTSEFAHLYRQSASTIESISTIGTFSTPTSGKCRFGEVSASFLPGLYEIQFPDTAWSFANAESCTLMVHGASNLRPYVGRIMLPKYDPYDAQRLGLTAFPAVDTGNAGAILTSGTGTAQLSVSGGATDANVTKWSGTAVATPDTAGYPKVTLKTGTGTGEVAVTAGVVSADTVQIDGDDVAVGNLKTMLDGTGGKTLSLGRVVVDNTAGSGAAITVSAPTNYATVHLQQSAGPGAALSISGNALGEESPFCVSSANTLHAVKFAGGHSGLYCNGTLAALWCQGGVIGILGIADDHGMRLSGGVSDLDAENGTTTLTLAKGDNITGFNDPTPQENADVRWRIDSGDVVVYEADRTTEYSRRVIDTATTDNTVITGKA